MRKRNHPHRSCLSQPPKHVSRVNNSDNQRTYTLQEDCQSQKRKIQTPCAPRLGRYQRTSSTTFRQCEQTTEGSRRRSYGSMCNVYSAKRRSRLTHRGISEAWNAADMKNTFPRFRRQRFSFLYSNLSICSGGSQCAFSSCCSLFLYTSYEFSSMRQL